MKIQANIWDSFQRSYCFPDSCNCEMMHFESVILQPMAFYSNLAFLFVGFYLLWRFFYHEHRNNKRLLLTFNIVLIGLASCFLHASFIEMAALLDFGFIFMFMAWVATSILFPSLELKRFILVWFGLSALPTLFISVFQSQRINTFAVLILPVIFLVVRFHRNHLQILETNRLMRNALITLGLALVFVLLDRHRLFCFDDIYLHGHTLWHILDAASIYFIYRYFEYHQEDVDHL